MDRQQLLLLLYSHEENLHVKTSLLFQQPEGTFLKDLVTLGGNTAFDFIPVVGLLKVADRFSHPTCHFFCLLSLVLAEAETGAALNIAAPQTLIISAVEEVD